MPGQDRTRPPEVNNRGSAYTELDADDVKTWNGDLLSLC